MKYKQQFKIHVGFYRLPSNYEPGRGLRDRVLHKDCEHYHMTFHTYSFNQSFLNSLGLNKQSTISLIDDTYKIYHFYFSVNHNKYDKLNEI